MKKRVIIITTITMLLFATVIFAFGETAIEYVNTIKSNDLLEQILADEITSEKAEVTESKVIQRLANTKNGENLRKYLESKGYLFDDINATLKKYIDLNILYSLSDNENNYIISLSKSGYDYEKIIDIFRFLKTNGKSISMVKEIYDNANGDFEDKFWIENAYENLTGINTLTIEDMYYYTRNGISVDEILSCYELSLHSSENISNMLDARVEGKSWYNIASSLLDLPEIQQDDDINISLIKNALLVATINGQSITEIIEDSEKFNIKEVAFQKIKQKYKLMDTIYKDFGVVEYDDKSIIEAAKDSIPDLSEDKIKEFISDGLRIKEIKEAVQ